MQALQIVASKAEKLYLKTRNAASHESAKRSKVAVKSSSWGGLHPLFNDTTNAAEIERERMLGSISGFRPQETVFEIGKRGGHNEATEAIKKRRDTIAAKKRKDDANEEHHDDTPTNHNIVITGTHNDCNSADPDNQLEADAHMDSASDSDVEVTFSNVASTKDPLTKSAFQDPSHFMSYTPKSINQAEDRGYAVHSAPAPNSNFVQTARGATMDLTNDENAKAFEPSRAKGLRWDKKSKKYVARANDEDGSKGAKMIRGESGMKIAASFQSGRFEAWKKSHKIDRLPRVGEFETTIISGAHGGSGAGAGVKKRYKHKTEKAPKEADKYRDDYHKRKKMVEAAKEKRVGRFRDGKGRSEIKGVEDVRKERGLKEKKRLKNARLSKKRR